MWEHCTFDRFLDVAKFITLTIIIINYVWTLIPNCWLENVFPTYFGMEI
jgi:hypothetical protein